MTIHSLLVLLHVGLGTVALVTFWMSGMTRKGSPLHRGAGKVYLLAMTGLLAAAVPLSVVIFQRAPVFGAFLFYLLVITVTSVWTSWRAIRDKRDWARFTGPVYRSLMWLNLAGGVAIAVIGALLATRMQVVIVSFSVIGIVTWFQMRRFARQPPEDPRWWLRQHLGSMLGNGVATHIAFLSIGLPKLLPMIAGPTLQNLAWLGPLVVAVLAGAYLTRKYVPRRQAARDEGSAAAG